MSDNTPEIVTETYQGPERRYRASSPEKQLVYDAAGLIRRAIRDRESLMRVQTRESGDDREQLMAAVRALIKTAMFRTTGVITPTGEKPVAE